MSPGSCPRGGTWGAGCQKLELLGFEMAPIDWGGSSYIMYIRLNMHGVQVFIRNPYPLEPPDKHSLRCW